MSYDTHEMLSVGIDVGTTTTQIIFSKLTISGVAQTSLPLGKSPFNHYMPTNIIGKKIIYRSKVHFTPLIGAEEIDAFALEKIIRQEYTNAGISPDQVETGAVIITGETAKKLNADVILDAISTLAGDFVVTVAGPHLEAMISGLGSGAAAFSSNHYTTSVCVDIGGGSANVSIFRQGEMIAAAAMNYGGRIMVINQNTAKIQNISEPAKIIINYLGLSLKVGTKISLDQLRSFTECMADLTVDLIEGAITPLSEQLMLTDPLPISGKGSKLFLSGGIGYCFYEPIAISSISDVAVYGDVGPLLAESLRLHPIMQSYDIQRPRETMQATVMGANSQTVTLSGNTIWAEKNILPIMNVPVLRPHWSAALPSRHQVEEAVKSAATLWDVTLNDNKFAIALNLADGLNYQSICELARGLADFARLHFLEGQPMIVIINRDYARVLGQTINGVVPNVPLVIIDQVDLRKGDYIDIGRPILEGTTVPLAVKTLAFYH